MSDSAGIDAVFWTEAEPARLALDVAHVAAVAPDMAFERPLDSVDSAHHGVWRGRLPVWPFERPEPDGLNDLVPEGLGCEMAYSAAHPMLPPQVRPIDPEPLLLERSQHRWHVAPAGTLCLMLSSGDWDPRDNVADLLIKAAAWRVEYALMKAGVVEAMTENGIVSDASLDHLVAEAVAVLAGQPDAGDPPGPGGDNP